MQWLLLLLLAAPYWAYIPPTSFSFAGAQFQNTNDAIAFVNTALATSEGVSLTSTSSGPNQAGALWYNGEVFISEFSVNFTYTATPSSSPLSTGLDGLAFVVQNFERLSVGGSGGNIGYGDQGPQWGISFCVAIELDTYRDPAPINDPNNNHIAIHASNGSFPILANEPGLALTTAVPRLNDGMPHNVTLTYNASILSVYFDSLPALLRIPISIETIVQSSSAWIGFTSSTGPQGGDSHIINAFSYNYVSQFDPNTTQIVGLNYTMNITAGDIVFFTMQTRDQYKNPIAVNSSVTPAVAIEEGLDVTLTWQALGEGSFSCQFTVTESGPWLLDVMIDGVLIPSSPYPLNVAAGPVSASHCLALGAGLYHAVASAISNFNVTIQDRYENPFLGNANLTITFLKGPQKITPAISSLGDGFYDVTYVATVIGSYSIAITAGSLGKPISGSPFALTVHGGSISDRLRQR